MTDTWIQTNQDGKQWEPIYTDVLDHGYVGLVDFMGDDSAIVNAARVSYGRGTKATSSDEGLIRYLMRHHHSTPLEMADFKFHVKAPIFVFRQWHRHRTACLAADVPIAFDLPNGIKSRGHSKYTLTVKDIFDRFQPTESVVRPDRQKNPYHKRDRVKAMHLRSLDETTHEFIHTNIEDIWESGEKEIIKVTFDNGDTLRASKDHLCFTDEGWLVLSRAIELNAKFASFGKQGGNTQSMTRKWVSVVDSHTDGYEMTYDMEVSGPFHNFIAGGVIVHNSINEYSGRYSILDNEMYVPHYDHTKPQALDNKQGRDQSLLDPEDYNAVRTALDHVNETSYQTYLYLCGPMEMEKDGPLVQANAPDVLQERRKTIEAAAMAAIQKTRQEQMAKPEDERIVFSESDIEVILRDWFIQSETHVITDEYPGVARELARMVLPVATYSQMYWKSNLHNTMHFLRLRADSHAQYEIRVYAEAMMDLITPIVPMAMRAFEDYQLHASNLSRMETELLKAARAGTVDITNNDAVVKFLTDAGCSARETSEYITRY